MKWNVNVPKYLQDTHSTMSFKVHMECGCGCRVHVEDHFGPLM